MIRGKKERFCEVCKTPFTSYNINPKFCSRKCRGENQRHKVCFKQVTELYEKGYTQEEVADMLGTSQKVIYSRMKENNYTARVAHKRNQEGALNDYWKGGRTYHSQGYVYVRDKNHPRALAMGGYVLEHILVVEEFIGRYLRDDEIIHHINEIKDDNNLSNLYITSLQEHTRMHSNGTSHLVVSNLQDYVSEEID